MTLSRRLSRKLSRIARRAGPGEACGVISVSGEQLRRLRVQKNHASGARFSMYPRRLPREFAVWHSHPGEAVPSKGDVLGAPDEVPFIITGTDGTKAYVKVGGSMIRLPLEVT